MLSKSTLSRDCQSHVSRSGVDSLKNFFTQGCTELVRAHGGIMRRSRRAASQRTTLFSPGFVCDDHVTVVRGVRSLSDRAVQGGVFQFGGDTGQRLQVPLTL